MISLFFSILQNVNTSASHLNNDLNKIRNWAFQWKMNFNPDPIKQAQEVIFSHKIQKNILKIHWVKLIKLLGYLLRKLQIILPHKPLLTIYKLFVRPHLYYSVRPLLVEMLFIIICAHWKEKLIITALKAQWQIWYILWGVSYLGVLFTRKILAWYDK